MNTKNIIIDCDPGIDDSLAILLALNSPELNVVGITTVSGNVPAPVGAENALKMLQIAGRLDIPVYMGAEKPLKVAYTSAANTHGADGLGESHLPQVTAARPKADANRFIQQTLTEQPDTTLVALGPLTNIAQALKQNPALFTQVPRFVLMGGNYRSFGNCSPVAEYNFWCDPNAAQYVFEHMPVPIEMVGLDVTRKIVLTPSILDYMKITDPKMGRLIEKITKFYFDFHWQQERLIGCVINDPLAVAYLLQPTLAQAFDTYTTVVPAGMARGQSIVDDHNFWHKPANSRVLTTVNAGAFWQLFLSRVLHAQEPELSQVLTQLGVLA